MGLGTEIKCLAGESPGLSATAAATAAAACPTLTLALALVLALAHVLLCIASPCPCGVLLDNGANRRPLVYALDPLNGTQGILTPAQERLVIGGEVSLWGEEIDQANIAMKAWPRGCAFAEKMWTPRKATVDAGAAGSRLVRMYCKIAARGIQASPISPGSCLQLG
jgi:hypothetical protein